MSTMTTARGCARLDYLNSQEPGDESQANAIDIVDRLLVEDDIETSQKISIDQINGKKSPSTLGSKVAQCLAKRVECICPLEKAGVFDWIDTPNLDDCTTSTISRENQRVHANNQMKYLDSQRCGGYGSGTRAGAILDCIDEDSGINYLKKPEPVATIDDVYEAYDIGPNTQMAAEAMESLFASTISYDVRENAHHVSSILRIDSGKETKVDKTCSAHSPIQKLTCLPKSLGGTSSKRKSSGGMTADSKQIKVDEMVRPNGKISSSLTKRPSKSKTRKNLKHMAGKAKGSMDTGIIQGTINHEVPEGYKGSGSDDSNIPYLLGKDAAIHPKRKRTNMCTSGSSKVEFNEASRSTALRGKTTEVKQSSTAKTVSISDPDTMGGMKIPEKTFLADHEASAASSADAFCGATVTPNKGRVIRKEISHSNQLEGILSVGLKKQSTSEWKDQNSSLTCRVPLRELNSTGPQSRTQTSNKPLKRGPPKSSGSRELASLFRNEVSPVLQSSRRRKRHMSTVRVLFSQSMDKEIIKDQTKILIHFGLPVATTISEATHFVAENFARTKNMLEAIAMGIPVVTPSWLECCGEARCFIDEKRYIMRDVKKEKLLGFSMPVSLSRACKKPLLEGRRVLITPHAKPSKELLKSLVVATCGQPMERITVSLVKNRNFEGAFVISCEQDYSICLPFIKNGLEVFDSELLLNGIVIQKLEFERYRLFRGKTM